VRRLGIDYCVPLLVVGNQFNSYEPQVTYQQAIAFSQTVGAKFIEVDVKTGFNVEETFMSMISLVKPSNIPAK
jgi:Ras family